ncbi:Piwi-domain-containing protein [Lentinus brumalis]|uniref:Piwi-domain-containing protein n=1 Tax=Lentinus brumalis TaxID=2498619 RepID=A0A371DRB0_9APHY|nr:Piwi-domain-containing protein [Polyporus brumalis]
MSGRFEAHSTGALFNQIVLRQRVTVRTNMFEITRAPNAVYYQYDVVINPPSITSARNYEIIDCMQSSYAAEFGSRPLYDGRALLYSQRDITTRTFPVSMRRDRAQPTHEVTITKRAVIDSSHVQLLIREGDADDKDDANYVVLQLCQLMVRQAPNFRHRFPAHSKSFYVANTAVDIDMGLQIWKGFFQSVRPTLGRLLLNVDHTAAPVYASGSLLRTMIQFLRLKDARDLQNLSRSEYLRLRSHLKGVVVRVTVSPNVRPKPIADLVEEAGRQEFDNKEGVRVTVSEHFANKYPNGIVRFPRAIGVRVGKSAIVPAEFCEIVPGQLFRKKLPPELQNDLLKAATTRPEKRQAAIQDAVHLDTFNWSTSDFIKDAGMSINPRMLEVTGDILKAPKIVYGNGEANVKDGTWNVVGRTFYLPAQGGLQAWAVAVFDSRVQRGTVSRFVSRLVKNLRDRGMVVRDDPPILFGNAMNPVLTLNNARAAAQEFGQVHQPDMILVILPANAEECRNTVKVWGDWGDLPARPAMPVLCVRSGKWDRANDQYCNNLALKFVACRRRTPEYSQASSRINPRLGGINCIIKSEASEFLKTAMVLGADVGHPGAGVHHLPSITGLVASVDPTITRYTSFSYLQEPRLELIQDLEDMMVRSLRDYQGFRQRHGDRNPPQHVVFFRDGVSEGEYRHIQEVEIPKIKSAFAEMGLQGAIAPKLLFIVVRKRHHVRFFPDKQDADKSGNCPAGFILFDGLKHPEYVDYYLQSQAGLLGTSRPAHYVVLENEAELSLPTIGQVAYHLCYQYARATRAVSIPAPVYYADLMCRRLTVTVQSCGGSDAASTVSGEPVLDLDRMRANHRQSGLNKRMHWL